MYIFTLKLEDPSNLININNKNLKRDIENGYVYDVSLYAKDLDEAYVKAHKIVEDDFESNIYLEDFKRAFSVRYKDPIITASQLVIYVQNMINKYGNKPLFINGSFVTNLSDYIKVDKKEECLKIESVF